VSSQLHRRVEHPHGTYHRYKLRRDPCRCEPCRAAAIEHRAAQRERIVARHICPRCGFRAATPEGHSTCQAVA
jgi:hypothetical protein